MADMDLMDRLLATAKLRLPGATDAATKLELFNAIDTFFRESSAWRYNITVPVVADETVFPIFAPAGTGLVQVMGATHNGLPLTALGDNDENTVIKQRGRIVAEEIFTPDYDALFSPAETQSPGGIFGYSIFFPTYISIDVPASNDAAQYPILMELALTLDPLVLQDDPSEWPLDPWMFTQFHEAWLAGVQFNMLSQPSKPYSNTQLALVHGKNFRRHTARQRQIAMRGYVFNKPNWRYPAFGGQGR